MENFKTFYEMAYPDSFSFQEFNSQTSFAKKLAYCSKHLQRLASGSSRVIFKIDEEKVLKVAKNKKGLRQNATEDDYMFNQSYPDITATVFETGDVLDDGPFYLEMELARKVSRKAFKEFTGITIEEFSLYLKYQRRHRHRSPFGLDPEIKTHVENSDFFNGIIDMSNDFDLQNGDFGQLSNYGIVMRSGKPTLVLVDYGLSNDTWNTYYAIK